MNALRTRPYVLPAIILAIGIFMVSNRDRRRASAIAGTYQMQLPGAGFPNPPSIRIALRPDKRWTRVDSFPLPEKPIVGHDSGWFTIDKVTLVLHSELEQPNQGFTVSGDTLYARNARAVEQTERITGLKIPQQENILVRTSLAY